MQQVKRLIIEMHRRSIWQVVGVYLVGSWVGYQVITELADRIGLPDWVPGFAIVLFIIGLPIVVATALVQEGAPGFKRAAPEFSPIDPTLMPESAVTDRRHAPETPAGIHHALFTWKKTILGGVVAFLLLGVSAGGYIGMRNSGVGPFGSLVASGALDNRERLIIADFQTLSGDTALAGAVTEAFRMDFAQTDVVTVVEPAYVRDVLQRMSRDPKSRLDADLAREVAIRDNIKAYLAGELSRAGTKYIVAAKLVSSKDATVLASFRETASDSTVIIDAVDRLSKSLRERMGESLKTLRADRPLEAVSTPSLDALLKYTRGVYALDVERDVSTAITMLQEALAVDSGFAMAWRKLAVAYANSGRGRELVVRSAIKAFENKDRLTDVERYETTAYYYFAVEQDLNKAISAYEMLRDRDPRASTNNLGLAYSRIKDFEKAAEAHREAIARDSLLSVGYGNLFADEMSLGRVDEARKTAATFQRKFPEDPGVEGMKAFLAYEAGDFAAAETGLRRMREMRRTPSNRVLAHTRLAQLATVQGKLTQAERELQTSAAIDLERGNTWAPLDAALDGVTTDLQVRRDPARAARNLAAALQANPLEPIPAINRPYFVIANLQALTGDVTRARTTIADYERAIPTELRGDDTDERLTLDGFIALTEKRTADAIDRLRRAVEASWCRTCLHSSLSLAFEAGNQPDSAIAYLEAHVNASHSPAGDAFVLGPALERLAELYEGKGNLEKAREYAGKFVERWKNADAELQPRVQAKQQMLRRLSERKN